MGIFIGWFVFSLIVGIIGADRKIGFWSSFFLSLILSPLIGLIIALLSKNKSEDIYEKNLLEIQKNTLNKLNEQEPVRKSLIEELEKLSLLKGKNIITQEEFLNLKSNILNNSDEYETEDHSSFYYFIYELEDLNIPSQINSKLNIDSIELLSQIKESEKYMRLFECNEYPFYAALVLDNRKEEIPKLLINELEIVAKKYFQCDSINDALLKIKENNIDSSINSEKKTKLDINVKDINSKPIGKYVVQTLNKVIDSNLISPQECIKLQRKDYSKKTFDIQFPFLAKENSQFYVRERYWKNSVIINREKFFVCSQWYEVPQNNDRPYYKTWLKNITR